MKVSTIELARYERCPRWHRMTSVERLTGDGFLRLQVRRTIHRYLALPPVRRNIREAESLLRDGWRTDPRRRQLYSDRDREREHGTRALAMLGLFVSQADQQGQPFMVGLDLSLSLTGRVHLVTTLDMVTMNRDGTVRAVTWYCSDDESIARDFDAVCAHRTVARRFQLHTRQFATFDLSTGAEDALELSRSWLDRVEVRASVQASLLNTEQDDSAESGGHCQYCAVECSVRKSQELCPGNL